MKIVDNWLNDLPQQFLEKKNIEALIRAFSKQLQELQQVFDDLENLTDLDTATGQNLDMVGTIIPLSRKEAGILAGINVEDPVISDERYRQFLRYQNLVNTNECTYYDLMNGLALLWDVSPIYYIEDPDMPATIILTMPFLKPGGEVVRVGEVPMVKPAGVRIEFEYQIKVVVETLVRWICATYDLLICGTFKCGTKPRPGTLGNIMYVETNLDMNAITNVFDTTLSGTIRIGGKLYNSTTGEIFTDDVEIIINSDYEIVDVLVAGQSVSGVYPAKAVNGVFIGESTEVGKTFTNTTTVLPLSGVVTSGGGKMMMPAKVRLSEDINIQSNSTELLSREKEPNLSFRHRYPTALRSVAKLSYLPQLSNGAELRLVENKSEGGKNDVILEYRFYE